MRRNRIRELREAKGWSQEKLARQSDLSLNALRMIENGETGNPGLYNAFRIARALGTDVGEVFPEEVPA